MKTSFWVFIVAAIFLVLFSVQNADNTNIKLLIWSYEVSKAVLIIATFLGGLITGAFYAYLSRKGKQKDLVSDTKFPGETPVKKDAMTD